MPPVSETVSVTILRMDDRGTRSTEDVLAIEEPLEIRIGHGKPRERRHHTVAITMRTPGHDAELALGFLLAEGVVERAQDVLAITQLAANVVRVDLRPDVLFNGTCLERHFYVSSACGVCGKTSIGPVARRPAAKCDILFARSMLHHLPETLRARQSTFDRTGGLHAAALISRCGDVVITREDIGRHNAVDKLTGAASLQSVDATDKLLLVSGRASYELVQKAVTAGIPAMAAIGAPSSLAVNLAEQFDITLIGFLRPDRFNVYASPWRIDGCHQGAVASEDSMRTPANSTTALDPNVRPACLP